MCLTATRAARLNPTPTRLKAKQEELKQALNHRFSFSFEHVSTFIYETTLEKLHNYLVLILLSWT